MIFIKTLKNTLKPSANPSHAVQQQAYMKSAMPFLGIRKPDLAKLVAPLIKAHNPRSNEEYRSILLETFSQAEYREEWYVALAYARHHKHYINADNIDLYIKMIRYAQWWDITDEVAAHLIGTALAGNHDLLKTMLKQWIVDECFWIRRTALLAQLNYKKKTDFMLLVNLILTVNHEKEFFIRKAIGWALRELSKTDANLVRSWVEDHKKQLSYLSYSQALKRIRLADSTASV